MCTVFTERAAAPQTTGPRLEPRTGGSIVAGKPTTRPPRLSKKGKVKGCTCWSVELLPLLAVLDDLLTVRLPAQLGHQGGHLHGDNHILYIECTTVRKKRCGAYTLHSVG